MPRLLFEKKSNAVWMSHLDLMRVFQRAFKRANLPLKHSQGFNPRPSVSIALPLSVGVESQCELLDFDLEGAPVSNGDILIKLNRSLVEGVRVLDVYDNGKKIRELSTLRCKIALEYDLGVPEGCVAAMKDLFARDALVVPKKSKNGIQEQNIIPMIRSVSFVAEGDKEVVIDAVICCQNPSLNPMQIPAAISAYIPDMKPDFCKCSRVEIYDKENSVFR